MKAQRTVRLTADLTLRSRGRTMVVRSSGEAFTVALSSLRDSLALWRELRRLPEVDSIGALRRFADVSGQPIVILVGDRTLARLEPGSTGGSLEKTLGLSPFKLSWRGLGSLLFRRL